jgi:hypothetical protein
MAVRQFPRGLRTRVRVAYAVAWEGLVTTHTEQALQFISEFASRVPPLEALELYLTVVPIGAGMHEAVRTRTLASLDLDCLPYRNPPPTLRGWRRLRLDLVIKLLRYRRAYAERTLELARMVGAQAAESITATHVENALQFAHLLAGHLPVERAIGEYLRAFYLPLGTGQVVMQRVKAAVAGSQLAAEYSRPAVPDPELLEPPATPAPAPWEGARGAPSTPAEAHPD